MVFQCSHGEGGSSTASKICSGEIVVGAVLALILYALIRRSPRRWWLYFWFASIPLVLFGLLIKPTIIDPLYDRFEPLAKSNPALVAELEKVVQRGGLANPSGPDVRDEGERQGHAAERLRHWIGGEQAGGGVGHGGTEDDDAGDHVRLRARDGTLRPGARATGNAIAIAGTFFLLYITWWASGWALRHWGDRWGIRALDDWASLPLIWLVMTVLMICRRTHR